MPMWTKMYFQNGNSPTMEHLIFFHEHSLIMIILIISMTSILLMKSLVSKKNNKFLLESHQTEMFWTTLPALVLMYMALPSLKTLYMMEENIMTPLSIKTMGAQWYWNYEYMNMNNKMEKLSYTTNMMKSMKMRNKMTNKNLIIPNLTPTRMMISSKDTLHSWTIPSIGVKSDATPGRINQTIIMTKRPTIMLGQCSEICGSGHSFMPIVLESPSMMIFMKLL